MKTASEIISAIGTQRLKNDFGIGDRVLQMYAKQGTLPASWFNYCETTLDCALPRGLFTFKATA